VDILSPAKRSRWCLCLTLAAAFCCGKVAAQSAPQGRSEYEVKALFFVTLARYTNWPTNAFGGDNSPIVIGVLGNTPITEHLEPLIKKERIQGRPLQVKRFGSIEEVNTCHLLFFGDLGALQQEVALSRLQRRPVLTASDRPRFTEQGGMIEMYVNEEKKIRLRIGRSAIEKAGLGISRSLLKIADGVAISDPPVLPTPWISIRPEVEGEKLHGKSEGVRLLATLAGEGKHGLKQ
jgi:hypothetical protein